MQIVQPNEPTTLLLDSTYMPFAIATAKGAFRAVLRGTGKGLDAYGAPFDWAKLQKRNLAVHPDQPCMRSAPQMGHEVVWPIPTIVVTNNRFFYHSRKKRQDNALPSVREVYDFYDGVCCFCGEKIRHIKDASREHVHSRALGGDHGIQNIVLAHKLCNSLAGHAMPKLDVNGKEIVPKLRILPNHFVLPSQAKMRTEWKPYLFLT